MCKHAKQKGGFSRRSGGSLAGRPIPEFQRTMNVSTRRTSMLIGALVALITALAILPDRAEAQGLTYSLVPSARWIDWDDDLGFDESRLLGGGINIGFGRYVGLTAFYHEDADATLFPDSDVETEIVQTGGEVTLAFGTGSLVPVIKGGASILRFRPNDDTIDDFTKLSFDYGGGLRAVLGETITGEVMVESSEYRFASERLVGGTVPTEEPIRQNLSLRAGLGIQLGSRTFDRAAETDRAVANTYDSPFDNFALAVEPGFSRFTFDDELAIEDQDAWGGRVGVDFGSFFGIRAMYWRGTEEDELTDFSDFTAWGGEAQFNLGAGPGINPYLVGGVTHFDWDVDTPEAQAIDGRNALTLGAGVDLDVSDRFRLSVAARDNILAGSDIGGDLIEEVSDPDDLIHNWQFSAGLSFVLGGGADRGERTVREQPEREDPAPTREVEEEPAPTADTVRTMRPDSVATPSDTIDVALPEGGDKRTIVLPVLEEGEIYIRFGPASGAGFRGVTTAAADSAAPLSEQALRELIREEVRALGGQGTDASTARLMEELEALEARLQQRLDRIADEERSPTVLTAEREDRPGVSREARETRPYTGLAVSDDTQLLLGVATDIGPAWSGSAFNLVPQVAVGIGEGKPSLMLNASLEYRFNQFSVGDRFRFTPMLSAGPSLVNQEGTDVRLSTFLGTGVTLVDDSGDADVNLFTGYQGVDFFDSGRLLLGLRLMR